jgi:glycosyltransferase involved in cell wall biosynthesis
VMVRSSLFDGDAISIREALFLGTPVVATDTGGRPDGVAVFPIGDTGRMIDLLGEALNAGKPPADAAPEDVSNIVSLVEIYEDLSRSA